MLEYTDGLLKNRSPDRLHASLDQYRIRMLSLGGLRNRGPKIFEPEGNGSPPRVARQPGAARTKVACNLVDFDHQVAAPIIVALSLGDGRQIGENGRFQPVLSRSELPAKR